jgi:hypothetical protein
MGELRKRPAILKMLALGTFSQMEMKLGGAAWACLNHGRTRGKTRTSSAKPKA